MICCSRSSLSDIWCTAFAALEEESGGRDIIGHFHEWMTGMAIGEIAH